MKWICRFFAGAALLAGSLLVAACSAGGCDLASSSGSGVAKAPQTLDEQADAIVREMSLTEKVGQMVMIGVQGTDLTDDSKFMLRRCRIGGGLLFDRNLESAEQTKAFISHMQDYAQGEEAHQKVPLFIGIDEEGGDVVRGKSFIASPPSQLEIGQTGDPGEAERSAAKVGKELKNLGINVNFAPVADVGSPDRRSFASDAAKVTSFVGRAADGYETAGILYAFKHFPGIGKGRVDSHKEVSTVDASMQTLESEDLAPFRKMIETRKPENMFILVSHLIYPAIDAEHSASQSRAVVTDLLREKMGYQGIIITDDMEMGAVANHAPYRQLGVNAVNAAVDIVMVCHE